MRKLSKKGVIWAMVMICLVLGYYLILSNRTLPMSEQERALETVSSVDKSLARNLETNYPPTVREVVKLFAEITICFYNEEVTDEQVKALVNQINKLYDDELLAQQSEEEYFKKLKEEIADYKENKRTITSYTLDSSVDVETSVTPDGSEWARLHCDFEITTPTVVSTQTYQFLLRKNKDGYYKIYGWWIQEAE